LAARLNGEIFAKPADVARAEDQAGVAGPQAGVELRFCVAEFGEPKHLFPLARVGGSGRD
jgi:hypothetical protein